MARNSSNEELQSLLDAIASSDVVESRIELLTKLRESDSFEKSELASLIASLTMFWEDFTCLDISQCMLNKTILGVAVKYLESDVSECLSHFLSLGIKASLWCIKHLKMTLMSTGESDEEEHYNIFFQLLMDLLHYSATCFSALERYPISDDKELKVIVEKYTLEQLNLIKESITELKRIHSFGPEILKVAQMVLDAVIKLCRIYINDVNMILLNAETEKDKASVNPGEVDNVNHVINLTKCTVDQCRDLGVIAASDGGNLVTLLNTSWKGVVALLQLGKAALAMKVNVADIILSLMSLVSGSLRCAAENWSSVTEKVTAAEAKRIFLPVKFYLINAVRISSQYPCQSFSVYKELTLCVLMISRFKFFLIEEELLKVAANILVELLEPVSFHLLNSILNSAQLKVEDKVIILNWLFNDDNHLCARDQTQNWKQIEMQTMFSLDSVNMQSSKILLLSRVALFLNLLKSSPDFGGDVRLGMARKLGWLMEALVDEEVYTSFLGLELPIPFGSGKTQEIAYQPMFVAVLHALKTFMVAISSDEAWKEMNSFLLENIFHPHFLCQEIVMELWCFLVRHAEEDTASDIINKMCSILTLLSSSESDLAPNSASRKVAKSICTLLSHVSQSTLDRIYTTVIGSSGSQLRSGALIALLMEGFPLDSLSLQMKTTATKRIMSDFVEFMESFKDASRRAHDSNVYGAPVFALASVFTSIQGNMSEISKKILRFLLQVIRSYESTQDNSFKSHLRLVLNETLGIISHMKHLYASDEMEEVVLDLQRLLISGPAVADTNLYQSKPNIANFMSGFGLTELDGSCSNAKSSAVVELYHMILREQHWALAHLAISAFGYFAARTSCNQLWRFVPQEAALSYDLETAKNANEDRFVGELKVFLEKETTLLTTALSSDQLQLLAKEGRILKELIKKQRVVELNTSKNDAMVIDEKQSDKLTNSGDGSKYENMEIDGENISNKRRKLPEEIRRGVELLQSGLKSIGDGISELQQNNIDSVEIRNKLLSHYSNLEDVIGKLVGSDYGE